MEQLWLIKELSERVLMRWRCGVFTFLCLQQALAVLRGASVWLCSSKAKAQCISLCFTLQIYSSGRFSWCFSAKGTIQTLAFQLLDIEQLSKYHKTTSRRLRLSFFLQVTGKRSEGIEADDFQGGVYEAAVNQEKRDDLRSHGELGVGGRLSEENDSGSEQEEVSVAALNVRAAATVRWQVTLRSIILLTAVHKHVNMIMLHQLWLCRCNHHLQQQW